MYFRANGKTAADPWYLIYNQNSATKKCVFQSVRHCYSRFIMTYIGAPAAIYVW